MKGYFFIRENIYDMIFIIDLKRIVIVYVGIVRYICGEFLVRKRGRKFIYKFFLRENEEIIVLMWYNSLNFYIFFYFILCLLDYIRKIEMCYVYKGLWVIMKLLIIM